MTRAAEFVTVDLARDVARWTGHSCLRVRRDGGAHCDIATPGAPEQVAHLDADRPFELIPHPVQKPWGREVWFSAVEARGVNQVRQGAGTVPLPWLTAAAPDWFGNDTVPVLAKRLEPRADAQRGELYFEVHDRKEELYLVTRVDPKLWPDGTGRVRLGLHAGAHDDALPDPWRPLHNALAEYRRRCAEVHAAAAAPADANSHPDPAATTLLDRQRDARAAVDALTLDHPVRVGTVIRVPSGVPHALQAGVEVLEFQTPDYQRRVLYSTQPVVTEPDWDPAHALSALRPPEDTAHLVTAFPAAGLHELARFDGFSVFALHLAAGDATRLPGGAHGVLAVIEGELVLDGAECGGGVVFLLAGPTLGRTVQARGAAARALVAVAHGKAK